MPDEGNLEESQLADKPRATGIRNTRSTRAASNEANKAASAMKFVTTEQMKEKSAKKRVASKKAGGEIL